MFKNVFNMFGAKDEELEKQPRQIPDAYTSALGDAQLLTMSAEYRAQSNKHGYDRIYCIALKHPEDGWVIQKVCYNLQDSTVASPVYDISIYDYADTPRDVMNILRAFDLKMKESNDHIPVAGSYQTYRGFGLQHGYAFDDTGKLFKVDPAQPLMRGVVMSRDGVHTLFSENAQKTKMDDWQDFYEHVVGKIAARFNVALDVLSSDKAYQKFIDNCQHPLKLMHALESYLGDAAVPLYKKTELLESIQEYSIVDTRNFETTANGQTAQYMVDVTILTALIRAGGAIARMPFEKGGVIDAENLSLMQSVGASIDLYARERVEIDARIANKMRDLMLAGKDPHGSELPLEKIFKEFPPTKPAPPAKLVYVSGKGYNTKPRL